MVDASPNRKRNSASRKGWVDVSSSNIKPCHERGTRVLVYLVSVVWMSHSEKQFVLILYGAGSLYVDRVHQ